MSTTSDRSGWVGVRPARGGAGMVQRLRPAGPRGVEQLRSAGPRRGLALRLRDYGAEARGGDAECALGVGTGDPVDREMVCLLKTLDRVSGELAVAPVDRAGGEAREGKPELKRADLPRPSGLQNARAGEQPAATEHRARLRPHDPVDRDTARLLKTLDRSCGQRAVAPVDRAG